MGHESRGLGKDTTLSRTVIMGRIRGVHGVRGFLKVESFADPIEQLLSYEPWLLGTEGSESPHGSYRIKSGQRHGRGLLVSLAGCDSREAAQALVGCTIEVEYTQLPPVDTDEFYWVDLEGLKVSTVDGYELGQIDHLFETGANDVIVVRGDKERMLPFIDDVVKAVDLKQGTLTVDWDPEF